MILFFYEKCTSESKELAKVVWNSGSYLTVSQLTDSFSSISDTHPERTPL